MRAGHVLVLASEVVPLPGLPTNGGGLRGWTLARGLERAGFAVTLRFPRHCLDDLGAAIAPAAREAALAHTFEWSRPDLAIAEARPDVVVCCSWLLAAQLSACPAPLAVDVAGPVLLEFLYQDPAKAAALAALKPRGLALAEFVTCAGERQRAYFYPWLLLAGFDAVSCASRVATVPISAPPAAERVHVERRTDADEPTILFAGLALPWQDPTVPLDAVLATLERRGRGRLEVLLVEHPVHSQGAAWYRALREGLQGHPRVTLHPPTPWPYERLWRRYHAADLAFDLFARNPERELAFNTRTVDYLAAGLPVLHGDYGELASPIARYDAGFVVDPADSTAVGAAVERALDAPDELRRRGDNARRLVDELLTWDRTVGPLAAWCAAPTRRAAGPLAPETLAPDLVRERRAALERVEQLTAALAERGAYVGRLEAAWAEQGERLAALDAELLPWRRSPWRRAAAQTLGAIRARIAPNSGKSGS